MQEEWGRLAGGQRAHRRLSGFLSSVHGLLVVNKAYARNTSQIIRIVLVTAAASASAFIWVFILLASLHLA